MVHPRPRRWLLWQRLTALALIIGVFSALWDMIKNRDHSLEMISNKLQSGSRTRTEFLRAVVTSAKDFLTHNKTKFNEMLERTAEEERNERTRGKGPFNFDTKGNAIADNLANEAQHVVHWLFYEILASSSFPDQILPSSRKLSHKLVHESKGNHGLYWFLMERKP